ncbi:class I SAM-dependent rRNA methyltransferase [Jejudonia soesokkakensis]|uniref:Class I SAM-dependent rRNA methyltransferase n=1 Tax=Jejudonia soesokkakensis TaxID=1323432 RepID=A0ABW2MTN0_9FLAO
MFHTAFPEIQPQILAVKVTANGERLVRQHHPWIFSESITKINKDGHAGDIAIIFSHSKNRPIGVGLYDPQSDIRIKMLHFGSGATLNAEFFSEKITHAYKLRLKLLETETNSYRLLFGENDGFPGFIVDVYAQVMVVKLYSEIWLPYFETILKELLATTKAETVVLRLSRKLQESKKVSALQLHDGQILFGILKDENVLFVEHGINFAANVIQGHKTGYFLDHRENRRRVGILSRNKTVLDVFSYAGGFSVHALANGATEVTSVDISKQALEVASENATLNINSGKHLTLCGDAFVILQELISEGKQYDVVVIDPPSFAKNKKEIKIALKKYAQLARLGIDLTKKRGKLILASCSSRVVAEDFFKINSEALKSQKRRFEVQLKTQHDIDHPVTFPEGAYLKTAYYKLLD